MSALPRIVAADLSLTATGVADTADGHIATRVITTKPNGDAERGQWRRMAGIVEDLTLQIEHGRGLPRMILIEGPSYGSKGIGTWDRGGLWWMTYGALHEYAPVVVVPPASLKLFAAGVGNATKNKMVDAVARRWPSIDTAADDNRIDAAALALMGLFHLGHDLGAETLPAKNRGALAKVTWPQAVGL